jgi:hypothetical protein
MISRIICVPGSIGSLYLMGLCLVGAPGNAHAVSSISISIGHMEASAGQARNVQFDVGLKGAQPSLGLKAQINSAAQKTWTDAGFSCASLANPQTGEWRCLGGSLTAARIKVPFSLTFNSKKIKGNQQFSADLALTEASFSDEAGLHAGEKVSGIVHAQASRKGDTWQWQADVDWQKGEVFWQPFYFATGGHRLKAGGQYSPQLLAIEHADLTLKNVGSLNMSTRLSLPDKGIQALKASTDNIDLAALYPMVLKPLLEKTSLNNLEMAGQANFRLEMQDGDAKSFQLNLKDADIEDKNGHFALYKVNASIPWSYDDAKTVSLAYQGGHFLQLPLGAANIAATLDRYALTAPQIKLPILDAALTVSDVSAVWAADEWHWHLRANLAPISMEDFSHALGWPTMQGKVAATIPLVTYSAGRLTTDGDIQFNVFDGSLTISKLAMQSPLGEAPRLTGNMKLANLDLGALTRTYSFGAIEGKLDGYVNNLELVNWKPVNFDASLYSSPGSYRKKISQRAVENISSLGGAGAAAAVQRSVLRFFENFNYSKLGLNCRLRGDLCEMGGVESTPQGYVIVKGSGIPSITVLGYNRQVSWGELLGRIKRVTDGNTKPIIK